MKYIQPLAIILVIISFASLVSASPSTKCQEKLQKFTISMQQLQQGLMFYYQEANIDTEQAVLQAVDRFYQHTNAVMLWCPAENTANCDPNTQGNPDSCPLTTNADDRTNKDLCRQDFEVIRWSTQQAFNVITATEIEDLLMDRDHSTKNVIDNIALQNTQLIVARQAENGPAAKAACYKLVDYSANRIVTCSYLYQGIGTVPPAGTAPTSACGMAFTKTVTGSVPKLWETLGDHANGYGLPTAANTQALRAANAKSWIAWDQEYQNQRDLVDQKLAACVRPTA